MELRAAARISAVVSSAILIEVVLEERVLRATGLVAGKNPLTTAAEASRPVKIGTIITATLMMLYPEHYG